MPRPRPLLPLGALASALALDAPAGAEDSYWFKRGGTYIGHGAVPYRVPTDLSVPPAWTWSNDDDELLRHGPVIDGRRSIYLMTAAGRLRKFSPDGVLLWSWNTSRQEGRSVTSPFLYGGRLYVTSMGSPAGTASAVHCLDMETGRPLWRAAVPAGGRVATDSSTVHVAEGILLGAARSLAGQKAYDGSDMIYAVNATNGGRLWDFVTDEGTVWNFMPSTPGDGTFLFATTCGVAERRRLADGGRVWRGALPGPGTSCGTGGGALGPTGVFYAAANHHPGPQLASPEAPLPGVAPCRGPLDCIEGMGILVAYRVSDGAILWSRRFFFGFAGQQYPTVATIDGRLTVVAGIGMNPLPPSPFMGPKFLPSWMRAIIQKLQLRSSILRMLLGIPVEHNAIATFDAETGKLIWFWEEEPWSYHAAAGEEHKLHERMARFRTDDRFEPACGPENWSIPAVAADGTILVGSGSTGNLYAIRDANGDGAIESHEVSTLKTGQAFRNGPALAPGMLAVAPCWGKMYVFGS